MGFIRGLGKFTGSLIFTTFLVLAILSMEVVNLTSYESIKAIVNDAFVKQITSSLGANLADLKTALLFQCTQSDKASIPLGNNLQSVTLDCNDVKNSDKSQLPALIAEAVVKSLYYKSYGCSFSNLVDCAKSPTNTINGVPAFFVSNEGNQLYRTAVIYLWIGTAVGLVILLASIETLVGRLQGVGWNLMFTGLPFVFLRQIQSAFLPPIPADVSGAVQSILDNFMSSLTTKFLVIFVIGIALLIVGYGLQFYNSKKTSKRKRK